MNMNHKLARISLDRGFTLIELMATTAIIGLLVTVAAPVMTSYMIRTQTAGGVLILEELSRRVAVEFVERGNLTSSLPASPEPDRIRSGKVIYDFDTLFGVGHEMWQRLEYLRRGDNRILVLRSYRKPRWNNEDIDIFLQIQMRDDGSLGFRCTVNTKSTPAEYVPASCDQGRPWNWNW